ncbi:uncharacterized protein LOC134202506 [Armigeres subalbatus]|uniref:uncharacterized protein LOC134202506 n=1 Tax=Armigeres subalbatus TaxID=124917 RepID=UPI002ED2C667
MVREIESFFHFLRSERQISLGERLPALNESVFGWVVCGGAAFSNQSVGVTENYSPQEARCEEHFVRTVRRGEDGRYTVSCPKDEDVLNQIGESRGIAARCLQSTQRRLSKDAELRGQYCFLMEEYLQLGHMTKITQIQPKRCYLPHHPVIKEASTTTKVRVVINVSSTASGTHHTRRFRSIIMRSRTKQVMLVTDVEKMFRQVLVCEEDSPLQSIL